MAVNKIFERPVAMRENITHYCPGCTHGVIHRLVAEVLDEEGLREKTCGVAPVGCSVLMYNYMNCDFLEAAHGRASAFATGLKRISPEMIVFSYQGDGDLASIGTNEILHAANRGEKITVIFVNNAIYGMTGGQMAPTTLPNQVTTTCPFGRDTETAGWPIRIRELLSSLRTPAYIARGSAHSPQWIIRTKKYIRKAFKYQEENRCFSLVEVLSNCPTNWGMTPNESTEWIADNMIPYFPLGELKTPEEVDVPTQTMIGKDN
ncbi:MAG: thiamine pyrophosphate-dependent enzyme [Candidatus Electryonea clarkiae]|nr:thiamine pyrophosphate-dependent enzyme [Candidatus Electryonea clarkiae]MDP8286866.1 thiamine pyrophosphate-dependent enzyme [Candidatus Electryonea clarkiae]